MKVIALTRFVYKDNTVSMHEGQIAEIADSIAADLIADGYVKEYSEGGGAVTPRGVCTIAQGFTAFDFNINAVSVSAVLDTSGELTPYSMVTGNVLGESYFGSGLYAYVFANTDAPSAKITREGGGAAPGEIEPTYISKTEEGGLFVVFMLPEGGTFGSPIVCRVAGTDGR